MVAAVAAVAGIFSFWFREEILIEMKFRIESE
jgi:hypothetical protein